MFHNKPRGPDQVLLCGREQDAVVRAGLADGQNDGTDHERIDQAACEGVREEHAREERERVIWGWGALREERAREGLREALARFIWGRGVLFCFVPTGGI